MEDRNVLIDTSVIIDFLRKANKRSSRLWQLQEQGITGHVSTITLFEVYAGAREPRHFDDLQRLFKWFVILPFTEPMAIQASAIFRTLKAHNQVIEFRDIFIAATAMVLEMPIVTLNLRHFQRIQGVHIYRKD